MFEQAGESYSMSELMQLEAAEETQKTAVHVSTVVLHAVYSALHRVWTAIRRPWPP